LVVVVNGSVVAVPLVGCEPFQPPEAVQDCASCVLHCSVAGDPISTLLLTATKETAGLAVAATVPVLRVDSVLEDCSQAASVDTAAHSINKRNRCDAFDGVVRLLLEWSTHPVFAEFCIFRPVSRPFNVIALSPSKKHGCMSARKIRRSMIRGIALSANMSPFANVSVICGVYGSASRKI
jgi:hypothetical protein